MIAVAQRVGHADQANRNKQMPFQFLRPYPAERKAVTQEHVRAHDEREQQRNP
jgi:hypothetical protein